MIKRILFVSSVIICILLLSFAINRVFTLMTAKPFSREIVESLQQFQHMSASEKEAYLKAKRKKADEMTAHQQFIVAKTLLHCDSEYMDVVKARQEAMYWLTKSAQQGLPEAQYCLVGWINSDASIFDLGDTIERTPENAFRWCSKSAQAGYTPAYGCLGGMYEHGIGVKKDIKLAKYWQRKGYVETGGFTDFDGGTSLLTRGELLIARMERFVRIALWMN